MKQIPLKYYSAKVSMIADLYPLLPGQFDVYIEPFAGSAALFWQLKMNSNSNTRYVLNDKESLLINFYEVFTTKFEALKRLVSSTIHSESQHKISRELIKSRAGDPVLLAWAFWLQCTLSFATEPGRGFAYSLKNGVNPTYVSNSKDLICQSCANRLEKATVFCRDFSKIPKLFDTPKSFWFVDPPYLGTHTGHYSWDKKSEIRLLEWLDTLKGNFMLCGFDNKYRKVWRKGRGFEYLEIEKAARANRKRSGKTKIETLTMNYKPPKFIQLSLV